MNIGRSTQKNGIALFIVMLTIVVLAIIMGAFFSAYKSHFSLTRSSNASQAASAACESVYQYVIFRGEHDKTWGSDKFEDSGKGDPMGSMLDFTEEPGTHNFSGTVESLDATFHGTLHNNLSGAASTEVAAIAQPGTIVCSVTARSGDSSRSAKFILRVAPLFDSSVLTRSDLRVNSEKLEMRSRDPNRNMLRAEGDIYVPDILTGKDSQFLLPDTDAADTKGMLWSKGDIHSYHSGGTSSEMIDLGEEFADAAKNSNGKIVSQADSHFPIFELTPDNLQLPESNQDVVVPPGKWNFVRTHALVDFSADYGRDTMMGEEVTEESFHGQVWVDVLEYYGDPNSDEPTKVYRATHRNDDLIQQMPANVVKGAFFPKNYKLDPATIATDNIVLPEYPTLSVDLLDSGQLVFKSAEGDANATFDLQNQSVKASSNSNIKVAGPFHLTSETTEAAIADGSVDETPPPSLILDYASAPSTTGGVAKAAIIADGTLNIKNGVTKGLGSLVSKNGDVLIKPHSTNSVSVDASQTGSGLLIYAGKNVILENPDQDSEWHIKGLVYARNGVKMEGHSQNATFEGSVVSLQKVDPEGTEGLKGIEFFECGDIEFIYNSELLDAYVRSLPGDRIQLESVYWTR